MAISGRIVAVIGAGPAGLYASKQLAADGHEVVLFNKDIKPGGLAEYGIYPGKHKMREGLRKQFRTILADPLIHYFGNIRVGSHGEINLEELKQAGFDAILVTAGAQSVKKLGIPGEDLAGVYPAKEVVYHYNLLPPFSRMEMPVGKRVAVVGAGNVMMDIVHWLIDEKQVDEVAAIVRRGPAEVKFDKKELEGVAANLDMEKLMREIDRVSPVMIANSQDPDAARQAYLDARAHAEPHTSSTRFSILFLSSPVKLRGDDRGKVVSMEIEETTLHPHGNTTLAFGTGTFKEIPVDTVILAIGDEVDKDLGLPLNGNKYDQSNEPAYPVEDTSYEVNNSNTGLPMQGVFLAGWSRKASTGLVGVARKDATNAAVAIHQYLTGTPPKNSPGTTKVLAAMNNRFTGAVHHQDILRLEQYEQEMATLQGLEEYKLDDNARMLAVIRTGSPDSQ